MNKKIKILAFFIIIAVIIIFFTIFQVKSFIYTQYVIDNISRDFNAVCKLRNSKAGLRYVEFDDFTMQHPAMKLFVAKMRIDFEITKKLEYFPKKISLKYAKLTSENIKMFIKYLTEVFARKPRNKESLPLTIHCENCIFDIRGSKEIFLGGIAGFSAKIKDNRITSLQNISAEPVIFRNRHLSAALNIAAASNDKNINEFNISYLKIQNNNLPEIKGEFEIAPEGISVDKLKTGLLGEQFEAWGNLRLFGLTKPSLSFNLQNLSLKELADLLIGKDKLALEGNFTGSLNASFIGKSAFQIEGKLINENGGTVIIKDRQALSFLRRYLDKESYEAFIDNMKNYQYNKSIITIEFGGQTTAINLEFISQIHGKRNLQFNLHKVISQKK
ncbi:MAG: YdbH domain-containing protein [Candidatus Omnitrophota bacterium]